MDFNNYNGKNLKNQVIYLTQKKIKTKLIK